MNTIKSIAKNIIIIAGLSAVTVFAWTGPTAPPPDNNTSAPINVSSTFQSKSGSLWIDGGLGVGGGATIGTYGGYVGIGSTAPSNKLEVLKASTPCCGVGSTYGLRVNYGGATYTGLHLGDFGYGNASVIQTFNQALSLNPAGNNVGIGTVSPESKLHVLDTAAVTTFTGDNDQGIRIGTGNVNNQWSLLGFSGGQGLNIAQIGAQQTVGGSYMSFGTSNGYATGITNTAMTINPSGNVGVGTTNPTEKLDVAGNIKATGNIKAAGALETGNRIQTPGGNDLLFEPSGIERMRIMSSTGSVGIGIASPTEKLDVVGNVKGTGLCIGSDCRTSWPSGGGGGVIGTGTPSALTNWTGANSIGNYSGASCPAGQVMSGLNATGAPNCVTQSTGGVSGFGTTGNLTTWNSITSVTNYAGSNVCLSGTYAAKVNADGTVNCMPSQMPTTQKICISDSTRVFTVPNTWLQVNCQGINAVWQGGRYQVGCIFSNSPYYSVSAGTIWNDPHGPPPNPNCGWD